MATAVAAAVDFKRRLHFYSPQFPSFPSHTYRTNILRKSCTKIDGKCDFGKRVALPERVDWSATSSWKKTAVRRFQRIFIASGYLS